MKLSLVLLMILIQFKNLDFHSTKAISGPYSIRVLKNEECKKTYKPFEKEKTVYYNFQTYNTSKRQFLMRGNITLTKARRDLRANLVGYKLEDNKWQLTFKISNKDCHALLLAMIVKAVGVKFDKRTCNISRGSYVFENLDINHVYHLWMRNREYGVMMLKTEIHSPAGTVLCWHAELEIVPAPEDN